MHILPYRWRHTEAGRNNGPGLCSPSLDRIVSNAEACTLPCWRSHAAQRATGGDCFRTPKR